MALYEQEKAQRLLAEELLHQEKIQKGIKPSGGYEYSLLWLSLSDSVISETYVKKWKKVKKIKLALQQKLHFSKEQSNSPVKEAELSPDDSSQQLQVSAVTE